MRCDVFRSQSRAWELTGLHPCVEVPQVGQTVEGVRKVTTVQLETVRQEMPAEVVQEHSWGADLPSEAGQTTILGLQGPGGYQQQQQQYMAEPVAVAPTQYVQGGSAAIPQ